MRRCGERAGGAGASPPRPVGWPEGAAATMATMPADGPGKILIPRWIQLVGLPLVVVGIWLLVSAVTGARNSLRP